MKSDSKATEVVMCTEKELDLILAVRSKFRGCDCCVEKMVELVENFEKVAS